MAGGSGLPASGRTELDAKTARSGHGGQRCVRRQWLRIGKVIFQRQQPRASSLQWCALGWEITRPWPRPRPGFWT